MNLWCFNSLSSQDRTGVLSGLHSSSQQSSQQFGHRHSDVVVGPFEGSEAQRGHVLQLAGPQERRLPLQLQQTLTSPNRNVKTLKSELKLV